MEFCQVILALISLTQYVNKSENSLFPPPKPRFLTISIKQAINVSHKDKQPTLSQFLFIILEQIYKHWSMAFFTKLQEVTGRLQ